MKELIFSREKSQEVTQRYYSPQILRKGLNFVSRSRAKGVKREQYIRVKLYMCKRGTFLCSDVLWLRRTTYKPR